MDATALLQTLAEDWGYDTPDDLIADYALDSVTPAICNIPDCGYSTEMEQDQDMGWCESCGTNTVVSAFILAGVI